jgi:hypothetical protein
MTDTTTAGATPASVWIGRVLSAVVALLLLADGVTQLLASASMRAEMEAAGFATSLLPILGIITLTCTILYAIPQTAVLGAILLTGFLGGAVCTHFRLNEIGSPPQLISLLLGVAAWGGLYLRDARVRSLLPFVS